MKIYYIYHSSFAISSKDTLLIFDFYNDSKESYEFVESLIKNHSRVYIFNSHSHSDHFHESILKLEKIHSNIDFIFSSDIKVESKNNRYVMYSNHFLDFKKLKIHSFGSTDLGLSFLVELDNFKIFHAGDLNWWDWGDEDTPSEADAMEKRFKKIVSNISRVTNTFDYLFFPVDPRLFERATKGVEYMLENFKVGHLIPMHIMDDVSMFEKSSNLLKEGKVISYSEKNSEIY